jgi:hypothetical protein
MARDDEEADIDSKIWCSPIAGQREAWLMHSAWRFAKDSWGGIGATLRSRSIADVPQKTLIALAARALKTGASEDLVGTFWFLAALKGSLPAGAVLLSLLKRRSTLKPSRSRYIAYRDWQARLGDVDPVARARDIGTGFAQIAEAADDDGAKNDNDCMVLVPELTEQLPRDRELRPYESLGAPLPLWRPSLSVDTIRKVLELEFPHFARAIDPVLRAVVSGGRGNDPAVVLVGPAGIGKDSLWRRAAELAGRPMAEFDLAGSSDSRSLRGTSRGWSNHLPSYPVLLAQRLNVANPLVLMTELEKAGGNSWNGLVFDSLLAWLDPGSRSQWFDEGLGLPVNLSRFTFCFSANTLDRIPGPLRNRLRIVHIEAIPPRDVEALVAGTRRRRAVELGVQVGDLPQISPEVMRRLRLAARRGGFNLHMLNRVVAVAAPESAVAPAKH